jgi:DHA1 family inner membrane transport protein
MSDISMAGTDLSALDRKSAAPRSRLAVALIELALAVGSFGIGTGESWASCRTSPTSSG